MPKLTNTDCEDKVYYTTREVADIARCSTDTVIRWCKKGIFKPSEFIQRGGKGKGYIYLIASEGVKRVLFPKKKKQKSSYDEVWELLN